MLIHMLTKAMVVDSGFEVQPSHPVIEIKVCLPAAVRFDDAAKCFVSYCPILKLHSAGQTQSTAMRALESAIEMFVRICFQRQILDDYLVEHGFVPGSSTNGTEDTSAPWYIELTEFGGKQFPLSVSMPFQAQAPAGTACHQ
jgi:predicted RNase H-like HicB family nuclease